MRLRLTKRLLRNGFALSLLLHLLFLLGLTTIIILQPQEQQQKSPQVYEVPSYIYKGAIKPSMQKPNTQAAQKPTPKQQEDRTEQSKSTAENKAPESMDQLLSSNARYQRSSENKRSKQEHPRSMLAASFEALKQDQMQAITSRQNADPILLIGDENMPADPLIRLIGRALSAHFQYPRTEGMMGIRGRVLLELTINLDGTFSDISMVRSSNNANLDAAALYAANSAPAIYGVDRFLKQPKHIVVGFIFY